MKIMSLSIMSAACLLVLVGCQTKPLTVTDPEPRTAAFFAQEVKPILELNCLKCHNAKVMPGSLNLSSKATAMAALPGRRPAIVPDRPSQSLLLEAVSRSGAHAKAMPPIYLSLTPEQIESLRAWIAAGALWPEGRAGALKARYNPENPYTPSEAINDVHDVVKNASM
jgi:hypothetical protein